MKKLKNRFLVLHINCSLDSLAKSFNKNQYSNKNGSGIISKSLNSKRITATFVEKQFVHEEINLPTGEIETQNRIKYVYFDIQASLIEDNVYLFQIVNAPLSIKSFIKFLSKLYPKLAVESYKFDLNQFYKCLKKNQSVEKARVTSLKASSIPFSDKSVAKIEIFSETDSLRELRKVYGNIGYRLDKFVLTIQINSIEYELSAASSGLITFNDEFNQAFAVESFIQSIKY